jgi:2-polyprenyl-3-methyl-5-hydroxy-6-metoxy-1,4-benzoquinol methylase
MSNYNNHLKNAYNNSTFTRKVNYIKYNFGEIISNLSNNNEVLEVGPGMGEMVSYLNKLGIFNIDVVDNDQGILKLIENKFKIRNVYLASNILKISKKLKIYDFIVLIQVLEHLPLEKQPEILQTLYSHLKRGGDLIIVVPNANNPLGLAERYGDLQHTVSYTEQSLKDLIDRAGIKRCKLEISGFRIPPYDIVNLIRIVFQKLLHLLLLLVMIVNGGTFFKTMTPNICLKVKKV